MICQRQIQSTICGLGLVVTVGHFHHILHGLIFFSLFTSYVGVEDIVPPKNVYNEICGKQNNNLLSLFLCLMSQEKTDRQLIKGFNKTISEQN